MASPQIIVDRAKREHKMNMKANHFHNRYEIYYLLSGERFYFIDHKMHLVLPGDMVLIDRYALHKTSDTGIAHHERILIEFELGCLQPMEDEVIEMLRKIFVRGGRIVRWSDQGRRNMEDLLHEMLRESAHHADYSEMVIRTSLMKLLVLAMRESLQDDNLRTEVFHPTMRKLISWVSENFREPQLSLEGISAQFAISKYYMCRLFKQSTGYTLIQYINLLRIRDAQKLLRETNYKIIEICGMVGFENVHHFCRVFKQISNQSPLQYRKMGD